MSSVVDVGDDEVGVEFDFEAVVQFDFPAEALFFDFGDDGAGVEGQDLVLDLGGDEGGGDGGEAAIDLLPFARLEEFDFFAVGVDDLEVVPIFLEQERGLFREVLGQELLGDLGELVEGDDAVVLGFGAEAQQEPENGEEDQFRFQGKCLIFNITNIRISCYLCKAL